MTNLLRISPPPPPDLGHVNSRDAGAFRLQQRIAAEMSLRDHRMGPANVSWPGLFACSPAGLKRPRRSRVERENFSHSKRYVGS